MFSFLFFSFLSWITLYIRVSTSQRNITFSALSVLHTGITGKSIVGAQWLAMQEINKNPDLLPNITLQLNSYDTAGDLSQALVTALNIINPNQISPTNETHFPIILGCPWSSLSSIISPALGAFQMGQISSGSTSIALADTSKYPYFYRTIPSDLLQAQGIILLCLEFNWSKIAVVYVNDAYGLYLSIGIVDLALESDIEATAVAFSNDEESTLHNAAYQVSQLDTFIIILIVHDTVLHAAFAAFAEEGLTGYPYFYIGVDAWLDGGSITSQNATSFAAGSIGTIPWQTLAMPLDSYDSGIRDVIAESMDKYVTMLDEWSLYWNNGYWNGLNVETPSTTSIYGYDAMYTLAYALSAYIGDGYDVDNLNMTQLNDIIINSISFIGTSGNVTFDALGDRSQGLYAFGNALDSGEISYFGYFYQDGTELSLSVEYEAIIWPSYFRSRGILPQSGIVTTVEIITISQSVLIPIYMLSIVSMMIALSYATLTWYYHENAVLRAASWKINLVTSIGCMMGYTTIIIYGIDERTLSPGASFTFLCNVRLWLWIMAYTLLFMPLFAKTYRLSRIFSKLLQRKEISDVYLLYGIVFCLAIDLVLLTMYTAIEPLERMHIASSSKRIDALQRTQYEYGSCETENGIQYIFYGLIALWKTIESLFGIYCALSVSRVGRKELSMFDETTQQLLAIAFLIFALCISIPIGLLGASDNPTYFYGVVGFITLSVGNVTTTLNMLPRLYAVVRGKTEAFTQSPQEKVEQLILQQLKKIGVHVTLQKKGSGSNLRTLAQIPTRSDKSYEEEDTVVTAITELPGSTRLHKKLSETPAIQANVATHIELQSPTSSV